MITLGHHAAAHASQLQPLLCTLEARAVLASAPPEILKSAGRTLRPLAHLLGVTLPPELQAPPRPPRPNLCSAPYPPPSGICSPSTRSTATPPAVHGLCHPPIVQKMKLA